MKFQSKTEEEIAKERLIPDGIYQFEVLDAKDAVSKAGNDMIALNLQIFMADTTARPLTDFLMEKVPHKLRHFCRETGLIGLYDTGSLSPEDCAGKTGYVKIGTQTRKDTGEPQNTVKDYVSKPGETPIVPTHAAPEAARPEDTEDVPF